MVAVDRILAGIVGRRRWLGRQPGAFRGAARTTTGADATDERFAGIGHRWRPGYARWVQDVLVWTPGPFFLRNALVPVDAVSVRNGLPGEVRGLGKAAVVATYLSGDSSIDLAAKDVSRPLVFKRTTGSPT